jgi:uncharacterized protein, YigZ family
MALPRYRTVGKIADSECDIRKSRFITHVCPIETADQADTVIASLKKETWKANHHCFAYVLGIKQDIQKASDDGEPAGTAGVPILDVLKKRGVCNALIVVTRFFGGIKLGAGGLIRAYTHAAADGLDAAEVIDRIPADRWQVAIDYHLSGMLDNRLTESPYLLNHVDYTDRVIYDICTRQAENAAFQDWIQNLTSGQADIRKTEELYLNQKVSGQDEQQR